jgi:hypothetical protein
MTVAVTTGPSFNAGTPQVLFERNVSDFDFASDGRILIVEPKDQSSAAGRLNVVVNWFEDVRRKRD